MAAATFLQDETALAQGHARPVDVQALPRSGAARVALVRRVPDLLDDFGVETDAILASQALSRADFENPDDRMPYFRLERLLVECERRTGAGLDALVRVYNLRRGGGIVYLVDSGEFARLIFAMATQGARNTRSYQMGALTIAFNIIEDLCGPDWQAAEVRLALRSPASTRPFQRFFRAPVHFDADECVIVFESSWLSHGLPEVGDTFRRSVAAEVRRVREQAFQDFPGLVRELIRKRLSTGPCSIETVAATLSMHRRSLERRLARAGEDYSSLQQSVKHEIAVQLLRDTEMSVQQIADFLRFSSAANFATAFRRWTGRTPTQYRGSES
jgi:AraC-like DNA-binding protein